MQSKYFQTPQEAMQYVLHNSFKPPIGKTFEIRKAYIRPDGTLGVEGWISTPKRDIEKDVLEPEAFAGDGLHAYMQRGAPISVDHNTRTIPSGYLQKSVLYRDSTALQTEYNPKQPLMPGEDFRAFEGGTGWYALGSIFNPSIAKAVQQGVLSSFSWLGMPVEWEDFPDGGKHFITKASVNPIIEVTLTAYPVNTSAVLRIAKSRGYVPRIDRKRAYELLANPLVAETVAEILVPPGVASAVIEEQLKQHRLSAGANKR